MSDSLRGKLTELIASGSEMVAFSDTFMGDEGCHVVNDMLRENKCVKSLDLRGCNIRADGAMALASLLTHKRTLTFLGLECDGVGVLETGVQALCKALATNISITEVDLRNNSIGWCCYRCNAELQHYNPPSRSAVEQPWCQRRQDDSSSDGEESPRIRARNFRQQTHGRLDPTGRLAAAS